MKCTLALRWCKFVARSNPRHLFRLFALRRCGFASNAGIFPFKTILQLYFNKFNPVPGTHREDGTKLQD
jgi:hypothetical protein